MSEKLLRFVEEFLATESNAEVFADEFIKRWRKEGASGLALSDNPQLSEVLSSTFCLADMYNPDADRESYELDEHKLRAKIRKLIVGILLKSNA
ncbi:colicin immunity domain-containing protein [Undibacterium sp. TC4M20W]|uniref:colicin immunity domain-containing protein n=1 Tax=Undibacterium sp. TC4M20W TaxID=3413052 RepID=UPI003BF3B079